MISLPCSHICLPKLIYIETFSSDNQAVVKEKGKGYLESNLFAVCNFALSLLPLKLNLPMVRKPLNWKHKDNIPFASTSKSARPIFRPASPNPLLKTLSVFDPAVIGAEAGGLAAAFTYVCLLPLDARQDQDADQGRRLALKKHPQHSR